MGRSCRALGVQGLGSEVGGIMGHRLRADGQQLSGSCILSRAQISERGYLSLVLVFGS